MTYVPAPHEQNNGKYVVGGNATNKLIIQTHLGLLNEENMCFLDVMSKDCEEVAEKVINYYKGLTLKGLSGKINDFEQRVLGMINRTVSFRDIGVVVSLLKGIL